MKLFFLLFFFSYSAWASSFSVVGALNYSERKEAGIKYTPRADYGVGALLEFSTAPLLGIEFGALYLPRKYEYSTISPITSTVTITHSMVEFPVLFRAHLGSILSLGFGAYYAILNDSLKVEVKTPSGTSNSTSKTQIFSKYDYGLASSAAIYIPFAPLTRIFIDGRYTISLNDNHPGPGDTKFNDLQFLLGLQLGL